MLKLILSFNIFIIFFRFTICYEAFIFSFKYFYNNNSNNSQFSLLNKLYNSYLYSNIKIGDPSYNIKTYISISTPHFSLYPNLELINKNNLENYYNINNSKSFKNISSLNRYYVLSKKDIEAREKFIINGYNLENKNVSEIILNDFDFVLGVNNTNNEDNNRTEIYYLTIGLKQLESYRDRFNLIYLLKEKNITNNYNWFIMFENKKKKDNELYSFDEFINTKANLIVGDLPHNYSSKEFSEENLIPTKSTNYYWLLYFNNIYYFKNDENSHEIIKQEIFYHQGIFSLNELILICPVEYYTNIKNDFFMQYISNNICHIYNDNEIQGFYCDKSKKFNINNLKKFPTLYFEHKDLNYTFELSYEDLFIEKNDKYYFLVGAENSNNQNWFLTCIFLKKYQFVFNPDSKIISFYDKKINIEEEINIEDENKNPEKRNNNGKRILVIILIIISWVIFIIIGIIIGRLLYKKYDKKKRANELEDNYEYISDKNIN